MIDVKAAGELLDMGARIGSGQRADEQLEGAVAIFNLLHREKVAYLADEVGMGKTYVALAVAFTLLGVNARDEVESEHQKKCESRWVHDLNRERREKRNKAWGGGNAL